MAFHIHLIIGWIRFLPLPDNLSFLRTFPINKIFGRMMEPQEDLVVEPAIQRHFDALKCSICYRWPISTCYRACYQDHGDFTCMECLDVQYDSANNENRERCPSCRGPLIPF